MPLPHMRTQIAFVLFSLPLSLLALTNDDREHAVPPHQRHAAALAGLGIQLTVAPVVLPPRHKDRDGDHDRDGDEAAVVYNLAPEQTPLSITRETRPMLVEGAQESVQMTTIVAE